MGDYVPLNGMKCYDELRVNPGYVTSSLVPLIIRIIVYNVTIAWV